MTYFLLFFEPKIKKTIIKFLYNYTPTLLCLSIKFYKKDTPKTKNGYLKYTAYRDTQKSIYLFVFFLLITVRTVRADANDTIATATQRESSTVSAVGGATGSSLAISLPA